MGISDDRHYAMTLKLLQGRLDELAGHLQATHAAQRDEAQRQFTTDALSLIMIEIRKLDALIQGTSLLRKDKVYLSVWSLNKGFQEIGGVWQTDPTLKALVGRITQEAYALFKQARTGF
jgi:hypothetical protein